MSNTDKTFYMAWVVDKNCNGKCYSKLLASTAASEVCVFDEQIQSCRLVVEGWVETKKGTT